MTAKIMDGRALSQKVKDEIKKKVEKMDIKPGLAVVIVGNDPASQVYVKGKEKACDEVGFLSKIIRLDENIDEIELIKHVQELNEDRNIHGFIVQLPLPSHLNEKLVTNTILPEKDADGFHVINLGNMLMGENMILPATPKGIMRLLDEYNIDLEGKHAVVVGRSNIVGKPISILLQQRNCTVTMCHSRTEPLEQYTRQADILVTSIGKAKMIKADMVKEGCVIVDVGMNRDENNKLCGDVDFDSVKEKASYITPVPGGVGLMTIAMLLLNTLECMEYREKI